MRVAFEYKYHGDENIVNESIIRGWFARFRSGNFSLENVPCGRSEAIVNNEELRAVLKTNTSQSTHELAATFHVSLKL